MAPRSAWAGNRRGGSTTSSSRPTWPAASSRLASTARRRRPITSRSSPRCGSPADRPGERVLVGWALATDPWPLIGGQCPPYEDACRRERRSADLRPLLALVLAGGAADG